MSPNKTVHIDVTKSRWNSPKKQVSKVDEQLTQAKFREDIPIWQVLLNDSTGLPGDITETAPPPNYVILEDYMTYDSIGPGKTVEEDLADASAILFTEAYGTTLPFSFFRNVWFDGLEAYPHEHWELYFDNFDTKKYYLVPVLGLAAGTVVRGRYVTK